MSLINPSETFIRSDAVLGDIDIKQRLIDLVAVPWNQEAEVPWRGEVWREVFRRGAFDGLEGHVGRVRVNREHVRGDTVGKLVFADPQSEAGLVVRAKIAETTRGDETLALAEDDMISPSIGYRLKEKGDLRINSQTRLREIIRAFLDHLGMVEAPAFAGAQVLAVRAEQSGLSEDKPLPPAPLIEEAMSDPVLAWAAERLNR